MYEVRDPHSGAILYRKGSTEKKVEQLESEVKNLREMIDQLLKGSKLTQNQSQN